MTPVIPTIRLMSNQETEDTGLHIGSLILEYNDNSYHLHGGTRDTIYAFRESICLYVLTINKALGYVSLNTYMAPEPDSINCVFLHTSQDIREALGERWEQLSPKTMTLRLIDRLI